MGVYDIFRTQPGIKIYGQESLETLGVIIMITANSHIAPRQAKKIRKC